MRGRVVFVEFLILKKKVNDRDEGKGCVCAY